MSDGICCGEAHYTCSECFEAYVQSEAGKSLGELKKREGREVCPANTDAKKGADRCHAPHFADKDIASNVSHEAFEAYLRARDKMREEQMVRRGAEREKPDGNLAAKVVAKKEKPLSCRCFVFCSRGRGLSPRPLFWHSAPSGICRNLLEPPSVERLTRRVVEARRDAPGD